MLGAERAPLRQHGWGLLLSCLAEPKEEPNRLLRDHRLVLIEPIDEQRMAEALALWHEVGLTRPSTIRGPISSAR